MKISVLFVCLGNICRSPTAQAVFEKWVQDRGVSERFEIDSAGTAAWHVGKPPDTRSVQFARKRGYELSHLRARQANAEDFDKFDVVLAMDKSNLKDLQALCPDDFIGHLGLFLDFAKDPESEVPDPYYGGELGFNRVLDLVEDASDGLLTFLLRRSAPSSDNLSSNNLSSNNLPSKKLSSNNRN
jgi:protein-tyrosine phosphatase